MAAQNFRVIFTESAWDDIGEIVGYWTDRDEPERGEQYAHNLPTEAIRQQEQRRNRSDDCGLQMLNVRRDPEDPASAGRKTTEEIRQAQHRAGRARSATKGFPLMRLDSCAFYCLHRNILRRLTGLR